MTVSTETVTTTRTALAQALEATIADLDYDLHKGLLDPEDEGGTTYADAERTFFAALDKATP